MTDCTAYGVDWRPDLPDPRDYLSSSETVGLLLRELRGLRRVPERADWREYFPPAEAAAPAHASVADACVQVVRYFARRSSGRILDPSRGFVYRTAQRLMCACGACGCELRTTWKAIARFGVPARRHWPDEVSLDVEPDAFVYAAADQLHPLFYARLDDRSAPGDVNLKTIKSFVAAGFAVAFGFSLFGVAAAESEIAFPTVFDSVRSGVAAVVVGYDDTRRTRSGKGTLLVRMPWGPAWGEQGYGWLPYAYVREHLALDFWTLLKSEWLESGEFLRPI